MTLPLLPPPGGPAAVAPRCRTWGELADVASTCTACAELAETRTQVVPGVLACGAGLMLVGEAPGAQEDAAGEPFVGRAGQLLDELLVEA